MKLLKQWFKPDVSLLCLLVCIFALLDPNNLESVIMELILVSACSHVILKVPSFSAFRILLGFEFIYCCFVNYFPAVVVALYGIEYYCRYEKNKFKINEEYDIDDLHKDIAHSMVGNFIYPD